MNDARVDHIEETLAQLTAKIDTLSTGMATRDDFKAFATHEDLKAGFAKAFEQTQAGFDAHRGFMELTVAHHVGALRTDMNQRFDKVEARFDRLETRFDGLETLIKGRPRPSRRRPRRRR